MLVVLGIGSLYVEKPRLQLSLALLIKSKFSHLIRRMSVYDPVLTVTEYRVLTALGCEDIKENESHRTTIHAPTVFYLPHFLYFLADELLQHNIVPWRLGWMSVLGDNYSHQGRTVVRLRCVKALLKHIVEVPMITPRRSDRFDTTFFG